MSDEWRPPRERSDPPERSGRLDRASRPGNRPPGSGNAFSDLFDNAESWLTPLSTDDGGKPVSNVETTPPEGDEPGTTGATFPPLGAAAVDNGAPDSADPPAEPAPDIARTALAGAQGIARPRRRRDTKAGREAARRTRRENLAGRNRGGYSAPGPDPATDPQRIGSLLGAYIDERGWDRPIAEARVFAEWPALVGAEVAAHCAPQSLTKGELRIAAESTAWATQLRLLAGTLLARLVAELGPQVVTKLIISGPVGPSWKHGAWSVRGARGPRDTYG